MRYGPVCTTPEYWEGTTGTEGLGSALVIRLSSPHVNRRQLLTIAGAATLATVAPTRAEAATRPLPVDPSPGLPRMKRSNPYRPLSISDPRDLPHFPRDARLVRWRWARASHTTLQDALATLAPNDVLVLPEDERPYEIDTSRGFRVTRHHYYSMASPTRGIVGLGPDAVIRPAASAFRKGPQGYRTGLQEKMIESRQHHAYFGNFTMHGRDFGGAAYNAIWASGTGTTWERIHFRGAHRGWLAIPPGEAGAICGYKGASMRAYNCEIDCRDESGRAVGTSPLMWNAQRDVEIADVYAHHTYVGMPSFWRVHDASARNLIHSNLDQGKPKSPGVNVEDCSGTFSLDDCTFLVGYGPDNHGMHLNTGSQRSSIRFLITNPTIDSGPWPGYFSIQEYSTNAQKRSDYHITRGNGESYPFRIAT